MSTDWGIRFILWLQQFSPALDTPFHLITALGDETFFLVFLPLLYWCVDRRIGLRLIILLMFSIYLNGLLKLLFDQPRPYQIDSRIKPLAELETGGFPSGHTQNTTVIWPSLALWLQRNWLWWVAALLLVLVPLSRLYLGVHFPLDLLGGFVLGLVLLGFAVRFIPRIEQWLAGQTLLVQLALALGFPLLLLLLLPEHDDGALSAIGALLGLGCGSALERRYVGFEAAGSWQQRCIRFGLGLLGLLILYVGLRIVFETWEPAWLWRIVRYAMLSLWAGVGAPWLFVRSGVANRTQLATQL